MRIKLIIAAVVGIVCGLLSTQVLLIGWGNLLFWGLVGVILGWFTKGKKEVIQSGLWYGFFLSLSFLFSGFQGTPDKLPGFILLSFALSVVGALGGWLSVFVGNKLKRKK
jgi:hypothetical protein